MISRAVVNANVILSALIRPQGPPGEVVRALARGEFDLVLSRAIFEELRRAAGYPKVRRLIRLSDRELDLAMTAIEVISCPVEPRFEIQMVTADPEDDIHLCGGRGPSRLHRKRRPSSPRPG